MSNHWKQLARISILEFNFVGTFMEPSYFLHLFQGFEASESIILMFLYRDAEPNSLKMLYLTEVRPLLEYAVPV